MPNILTLHYLVGYVCEWIIALRTFRMCWNQAHRVKWMDIQIVLTSRKFWHCEHYIISNQLFFFPGTWCTGRLRSYSLCLLSINSVITLTNMTSVDNQHLDRKTLLIGSSLLRYIDEQRLQATEVRCLYGALVKQIALELEALADGGAKYARIIIVAGGNDAAVLKKDIDLEATVNSLRVAIIAAKRMCDDIAVSEIPPRFSPLHVNGNISTLNKEFYTLSEDLSVSFLPNRSYFYLPSNEINHKYYDDDAHLTFKGTQKLIECLGVTSYRYIGSCSLQPTQTSPMTRPSLPPRRGSQKHRSLYPSLTRSREQMKPETPTCGHSLSTSALTGSLEHMATPPIQRHECKKARNPKAHFEWRNGEYICVAFGMLLQTLLQRVVQWIMISTHWYTT